MTFLNDLQTNLNINLTDEQTVLFNKYFNKLISFNLHTNLTTITEETDVYYKHFYDSLTINSYILVKDGSLCDMGSGAGFPSIPLKIINPDLKITIIDSSNKRIKFLSELVSELNLSDVELVHSRIEVYGKSNQLKFDYVTARALGNLTLISELAIPMLKLNGQFIAMKGPHNQEELNSANNTISITGGKLVSKNYLELPNNYGNRSIYIINKEKEVNGYPRDYQLILKKPL